MKTTNLQKKELLEKDLRSYKKLYELQKSIKEEIDELKSSIISDMEELGESKISIDGGTFKLMPEYKRASADTKLLMNVYPNVWEKVKNVYTVNKYIKFTKDWFVWLLEIKLEHTRTMKVKL